MCVCNSLAVLQWLLGCGAAGLRLALGRFGRILFGSPGGGGVPSLRGVFGQRRRRSGFGLPRASPVSKLLALALPVQGPGCLAKLKTPPLHHAGSMTLCHS